MNYTGQGPDFVTQIPPASHDIKTFGFDTTFECLLGMYCDVKPTDEKNIAFCMV